MGKVRGEHGDKIMVGGPAIVRWMKTLFSGLLMLAVIFAPPPPVLPQDGVINLGFEDDRLSATIQNAPLLDVLMKIASREGLFIQGKQHLADEKITAEFHALELEEGLDRILSSMNYSLVFDSDTGLVGIVLLGKIPDTRTSYNKRPTTRRRYPSRYRRR